MSIKAYEALTGQAEAAALEGIHTPSPATLKLLRRHRDLLKRREEINSELKAIESAVLAELEDLDGRAFAVNGKNAVLISDVNKTVKDMDAFSEQFPEIVAQYQEKEALFVSKEKQARARVTFNTKVV